MAAEGNLLEEQVVEVRRLYDYISGSMDRLRTKTLALLAGEVAIVSFLFSSGKTDENRDIITSVSDIVFFGTGVALLALAFVLFLWLLQPVDWEHPPDTAELLESDRHFGGNGEKFLERVLKHYLRVIPECNRKLSSRSRKFVQAVYFLAIGVFIVAVLKYGNGGSAL
jgi:hypothetical protein